MEFHLTSPAFTGAGLRGRLRRGMKAAPAVGRRPRACLGKLPMKHTCCISIAVLLMACAHEVQDDPERPEETGDVVQGLTQVTGFGSNPGNLQMFTHVPSGLPANAPVVLVLHGCTQTAAGMEASGWTAA